MMKTPISCWIEANYGAVDFEQSLVRLLSFACAEWIRRANGVKMRSDEALALFLGSAVEAGIPMGLWLQDPIKFADDIGAFCEKSKAAPLPASLKREFPTVLDLRGVKCPNNSVQSRLFLAGAPAGQEYRIVLDDGAPIENVPGSLVADGHEIAGREKKENFWILKVVKKSNK